MSAPESAISVYEMEDPELIQEIHAKLTAVDTMLTSVFKSHAPLPGDTMTELEHSVAILRSLESTLDSLRNTNPMVLIKQLMGL